MVHSKDDKSDPVKYAADFKRREFHGAQGFGGGGYERFKHKFVESLNQELMKLKGEPAFSDLPMKTLIGWGLLLLGVGGCKLIGVAEERAVILTAGPAQILVENRTGWPLCVWMLDEQTASVIDIGFEPCTAPNVATGETKIFPVYIPEGEPGIRMIVFWAPFQQNTWRWQRIWVPASKLGLQAIFGQ